MDKAFWRDAAVRAVKTFAQAVLGFMTAGSIGITQLDWPQILNVSALVALASLLTSVTSLSTVGGPAPGVAVTVPPLKTVGPVTPVAARVDLTKTPDVVPVYKLPPPTIFDPLK